MSRSSKQQRPKEVAIATGGNASAAAPAWLGSDWMIALLLLAALLLVYYPGLRGTPVWDDNAHLTRPELRSWTGLGRIWYDLRATQQYYPLTHTVFWIEHRLWGDWYPGYHLVNVLLLAASALALVRLLRKLEIPGAWMAAALWALHPMQVESVAWMSELKNTLSGLFYFSAALVYLRFTSTRSLRTWFTAFGLFILGLLTKSVIDTLPAALLLIFYWKVGKLSWRRDVLPLIPYFVTGIGSGLFTAWVERTVLGARGGNYDFSLIERCLIAGRVFWFYLFKLLWPVDLTFIYPRWEISASVWWQYLFPAAALALVGGLVWMSRRWGRAPLIATLYFGGTLFPALGFVNVYPFRYSFVADHFQYLACLGPIVLFSAGIQSLRERRMKRHTLVMPLLCAMLLGILGLLTWRQSATYRDEQTLWRITIDRNPDCWLARTNLGNELLQQGHTAEAITLFREALQINPAYEVACSDLGSALLRQGYTVEAIAQFREALRIDPTLATPHSNLGAALLRQGRTQEAIAEYREALRIDPTYWEAHYNLGNALFKERQDAEAIVHTEKALELQPANPSIQNTLAWMLATAPQTSLRDGARAVQLATQASQAGGGNNPGLLRTLAAAYAQAGQYPNAVQAAQKALELPQTASNIALVGTLRREITLYQAGLPFEEQ